jgi:hypothetical protein
MFLRGASYAILQPGAARRLGQRVRRGAHAHRGSRSDQSDNPLVLYECVPLLQVITPRGINREPPRTGTGRGRTGAGRAQGLTFACGIQWSEWLVVDTW